MEGKIGPYHLIRELGRGGLGVVWLARHELLGVERAVKVLRADVAQDPEQVARFLREARHLAGRARQPHLVTVHEVGQLEGGGLFLAMDLVPGEDLARVIRDQGPLEPLRAARIARDLALAVEALHHLGVVHRDLKPGNVMLRPGDRPCLIDLGLSRAFTDSGERLTPSGELMGTPVYMSPEQARGDKDVGPPADVWALGLILHALVAGQPAVAGGAAVEVLERVMKGELMPLETAAPHAPLELCRIRDRACQLDPRRRFRSAGELAAALDRFLAPSSESGESRPALAAPPGDPRALRALALLAAISMAALGSLLLARAVARWRAGPVAEGAEAVVDAAPPPSGVDPEPAPLPAGVQLVQVVSFELKRPTDCAFDRTGRRLAVAAGGPSGLRLYALELGKWLPHHEAPVEATGCAVSPDGARVLAITNGGHTLLDFASFAEEPLDPLPGPGCGACGPDGLVAWAGGSRVAVRKGTQLLFTTALPARVYACAFRDENTLVCLSAAGELVELDLTRPADPLVRRWSPWGERTLACAFSPDGRHLALVAEGTWAVVETRRDGAIHTGGHDAARLEACALSPGGRLLAIGHPAGLLLFDTIRGGPAARLEPPGGAVDACNFSGDGALVATGGEQGVVSLWSVHLPE